MASDQPSVTSAGLMVSAGKTNYRTLGLLTAESLLGTLRVKGPARQGADLGFWVPDAAHDRT